MLQTKSTQTYINDTYRPHSKKKLIWSVGCKFVSILCAFANFETQNQHSSRENNTAGLLYLTEILHTHCSQQAISFEGCMV